MPINLANINVSLQQFQAISHGKYNAGEVKLSSETTLDKVNNHVHSTGKNKTELSHAEVLAIKQAFVKALTQGGVGANEIARVRRELGLGTDKTVDTSLKDRSVRPLSRQQIREILDRNAAAINAHAGAETIRTSDQLYAGVSAGKRQLRAAAREAVNAALDPGRTVAEQHRVSLFQALVAGDVDFRSQADRKELLKMANEALDIVIEKSGGHPRAGVPARIAIGDGQVKSLSMDTGMDEAAWARKLEDMIVRLKGLAPDSRIIRFREEFRALSPEGRAAWIASLPPELGGEAWKVRTAVVALLQDAGIADYESLDLVNNLPDAAAKAFLVNLSQLPQGASEEAARDVLAPARNLAGAPAASKAYIPAGTVKDFNEEVRMIFTSHCERRFGAFKTLAADILADVRAIFGPDIAGPKADAGHFLDIGSVDAAIEALGEGVRATPGGLREALLRAARANAADKAISQHVERRGAELGAARFNPKGVANVLKAVLPDLVGRLAACAGADEVAAALSSVEDRVDAEIRRAEATERFKEAFAGMARAALSAKTGIPASALVEPALSRTALQGLAGAVQDRISDRKVPAESEAEIEQAFRAEAERFAAERAAILEKADALPISAAGKAELKEWLLAQDKVKYLDLDALLPAARELAFAPLAAALRQHAPKEQVYAAMKPLVAAVRRAANDYLTGRVREIGAPEMTNVSSILLIAAFDLNGIRGDLADFFARPEVAADEELRDDPDQAAYASRPFALNAAPPADEANAALAGKIGAGEPSPAYAQALARAVRAEGLDLSPDEALAVFTTDTALGGVLATILGEFHGEIAPETLEALARGAIRTHGGGGDIPQMVETLRGDLLDKVEKNRFYSLPERYLDAAQDAVAALRRKFGAAAVPENALFTNVADLSGLVLRLRPLVEAARAGRRIVTPAEFRQIAYEEGASVLTTKAVRAELSAIAAQLGRPAPSFAVARAFLQRNPLLARALREADDPDDIRSALAGAREAIRAAEAQESQLAALVGGGSELMAEKLALGLRIAKEEARDFGYSTVLASRLRTLKSDIQDGTHPGCREPGFSAPAAFDAIIDDYARAYVARFAAIDALEGVSDETKADLKAIVRRENRPDKPFIDPARARRIAARVDGAALLAALGDPNATDEARIAAIRAYADAIEAAAAEEFRDLVAQRGEGLGTDDFLPLLANVRALVIGATPGLKAALARLAEDPFALRAPVAFMQGEHLDHPLRATVANTLF